MQPMTEQGRALTFIQDRNRVGHKLDLQSIWTSPGPSLSSMFLLDSLGFNFGGLTTWIGSFFDFGYT